MPNDDYDIKHDEFMTSCPNIKRGGGLNEQLPIVTKGQHRSFHCLRKSAIVRISPSSRISIDMGEYVKAKNGRGLLPKR